MTKIIVCIGKQKCSIKSPVIWWTASPTMESLPLNGCAAERQDRAVGTADANVYLEIRWCTDENKSKVIFPCHQYPCKT